jgi:hypothetical protein
MKENNLPLYTRRDKEGIGGHFSIVDFAIYKGMLPTPTAMDSTNATSVMKSTQVKEGSMHSVTLARAIHMRMLPTPRAKQIENSIQRVKDGKIDSLTSMAKLGMLPTPSLRDYKGACSTEALERAERNNTNSLPDVFAQTGKTSQLNPRFVAEMMGFPVNWTELPFQNGEPKALGPTEMPLSPK